MDPRKFFHNARGLLEAHVGYKAIFANLENGGQGLVLRNEGSQDAERGSVYQ